MQLEEYFDRQSVGDKTSIRIKGSRIGIEHVLMLFIQGESPEGIWRGFRHTLTLEQVYATITYYLHNKKELDAYLEATWAEEDRAYEEYLKQEPPPVVKRLRAIKAEREAEAVRSH